LLVLSVMITAAPGKGYKQKRRDSVATGRPQTLLLSGLHF